MDLEQYFSQNYLEARDKFLEVCSVKGFAIQTVRNKKQVRDAFYCDEVKWKEMLYERAFDVVDSTIRKLGASADEEVVF